MNEKFDDGGIILQERIAISPGETLHSLDMKADEIGTRLILKALNQIENDSVSLMTNSREEATYYSYPTSSNIGKAIGNK